MNPIIARIKTAITFFKDTLWRMDTDTLPPLRAKAFKALKLLILSVQGFHADHCSLRASALTLYTLLSIVPIFAMMFGIAKGFGIERLLQERLLEQFREQGEVALKIIDFAQALLAKTQGGLVAGVGVAVLFWSVMSVIGQIETSFNHIWKIEHTRGFGRKVSDYLSLMLLAPLLLIVANSLAVSAQSRISGLITAAALPSFGSDLLLSALNYLALLIIWLLFSITFIFMPNTLVKYRSGILAGVVTGTAYQLLQWAYFRLQIGVSSYNAIYGSFAALPLFIVWLQSSWLIVLFGAELAFYHQHFEDYRSKNLLLGCSFSLKKILALRVAHLLTQQFARAEPPLTADAIAQLLHLPLDVVQSIVGDLLAARILSEVRGEGNDAVAYQPGRDIGLLRIATIVEALENTGSQELQDNEASDRFTAIATQFSEAIRNSPQNQLLKDI